MTYKYLASPYTDPDPAVMQQRFEAAERATVWLLNQGAWVYSPIVHCHALALRYDLPKDFGFWMTYNIEMLASAAELYVLAIPGWEGSKGIRGEWTFAEQRGMPICTVKPKEHSYDISEAV